MAFTKNWQILLLKINHVRESPASRRNLVQNSDGGIVINLTHLNTTAIICDLKELQPAVFDENFQGCGPSIHGVFNEFLEGVHRGDDDLASRNFIHYIWVQRLIRAAATRLAPSVVIFPGDEDEAWFGGMAIHLYSPNGSRLVRDVICFALGARRGIHIHLIHVFDREEKPASGKLSSFQKEAHRRAHGMGESCVLTVHPERLSMLNRSNDGEPEQQFAEDSWRKAR
jgi:hypothetical protein